MLQDYTYDRPQDEYHDDRADQVAHPGVAWHGHSGGSSKVATAARARSKNASLVSSSRGWIGVPNLTAESSGNRMNSPLGRIRFRFSRCTGTSCTCGKCLARL